MEVRMLEDNVKKLINDKAEDLNNQSNIAEHVSGIIDNLNRYIDLKIELDISQLNSYLNDLSKYFTTTLYISLSPGLKLLRARAFKTPHREKKVQELSYISNEKRENASLGRLNLSAEPVYYGCIYFNDVYGGVNVGFSEINATPNQTINILRSEVITKLDVYFIGIYDYIFRETRPYFITEDIFNYFKEIYNFQKCKYSKDVFLAHQLCDTFFSNILRMIEHGNLYKVTSILSKLFLEGNEIDGVVYTSVKAEGSPVVAIKTTSVDSKLSHKKVESFLIQRDYGYSFYKALPNGLGEISGDKIVWQ